MYLSTTPIKLHRYLKLHERLAISTYLLFTQHKNLNVNGTAQWRFCPYFTTDMCKDIVILRIFYSFYFKNIDFTKLKYLFSLALSFSGSFPVFIIHFNIAQEWQKRHCIFMSFNISVFLQTTQYNNIT